MKIQMKIHCLHGNWCENSVRLPNNLILQWELKNVSHPSFFFSLSVYGRSHINQNNNKTPKAYMLHMHNCAPHLSLFHKKEWKTNRNELNHFLRFRLYVISTHLPLNPLNPLREKKTLWFELCCAIGENVQPYRTIGKSFIILPYYADAYVLFWMLWNANNEEKNTE